MSRTGLLVIKAWAEPGSSSPLRAQIRLTIDVSQGFERSLVVTETEAVTAAVSAWLSEMLASSPSVEDELDFLLAMIADGYCGPTSWTACGCFR